MPAVLKCKMLFINLIDIEARKDFCNSARSTTFVLDFLLVFI